MELFARYDFQWGGDWEKLKDFQHFQIDPETLRNRMVRLLEVNANDEEVVAGGRSVLLNKVAGVVITGSEDGAQQVLGSILEVLTFMNFTIPPQACAYWVGEVGEDPKTDAERRRKNKATPHMAENMAKGLVYYAQLLKKEPMK